MVTACHLDYLVEADMVELANLLPMDSIDRRDKLTVGAPPAILFSFSPSIAVLGLICGFVLSLTLALAEDCMNSLLAGGMACREVKQLLRHP
jgi:hypothetical protein